MKTLSNREKAFSYHLYGSGEDGLVTFVLSIPIAHLDAFISYADYRKKMYLPRPNVSRRSDEEVAAEYKFFCEKVLALFDSFIAKNFTRSEAISKANSAMKEKYVFCTYERVKNAVMRFRKIKKQS